MSCQCLPICLLFLDFCGSLVSGNMELSTTNHRPEQEKKISRGKSHSNRMQLFCLQLEAFCFQLSFFAYNCVWELFCLQLELYYLQFELFCLQLSFFAYSGKVSLRNTSTDCKQRSSTVSKKLVKKLPPL